MSITLEHYKMWKLGDFFIYLFIYFAPKVEKRLIAKLSKIYVEHFHAVGVSENAHQN